MSGDLEAGGSAEAVHPSVAPLPNTLLCRLLSLLVLFATLLVIVDVLHEGHLEATGQSEACSDVLCRTERLFEAMDTHARAVRVPKM